MNEIRRIYAKHSRNVILCKECNFYNDSGRNCWITGLIGINPDDFCCWAERRDEADDGQGQDSSCKADHESI